MALVFDGGKLQRLRILAGLSTRELAKALGCSAKSVTNWESDRFPPQAKHVRTIAAYFKVQPKELYQETEKVEA